MDRARDSCALQNGALAVLPTGSLWGARQLVRAMSDVSAHPGHTEPHARTAASETDTRRVRPGASASRSDFALTIGDGPSERNGACRSAGSREEAKTQCPAEKAAEKAVKAETLSPQWPSLASS